MDNGPTMQLWWNRKICRHRPVGAVLRQVAIIGLAIIKSRNR